MTFKFSSEQQRLTAVENIFNDVSKDGRQLVSSRHLGDLCSVLNTWHSLANLLSNSRNSVSLHPGTTSAFNVQYCSISPTERNIGWVFVMVFHPTWADS
jgi:hypothetical protein